MNNHEVASLACKILGIYIIVQAINVLFSLLYLSVTISFQDTLLNLSFAVGYIPFGILLWIFSDKLALIMVKKKDDNKKNPGMDINSIQRVAFSVLGLFFIGNSLPKLVSLVSNIYISTIEHRESSILIIKSGGPIAEFIIGLVIFFGSRCLVDFLKKMRTAGLDINDKTK